MRIAVARDTVLVPKNVICSLSFESSRCAKACSQNANVSLSRATSCSLVIVVSTAARCGDATPPTLPHRKSFPLVGEVDLNRGETHLRRRGPVVVLVRGHRLGGRDQIARGALLHLAQRVSHMTRRRRGGGHRGRALGGERGGQHRARHHESKGSNLHRTPPMKETSAACPAAGRRRLPSMSSSCRKFTAWILSKLPVRR